MQESKRGVGTSDVPKVMLQKVQVPVFFFNLETASVPPFLQGLMGVQLIQCQSLPELSRAYESYPDVKLFIFHIKSFDENIFKAIAQIPQKIDHAKVIVLAGSDFQQVGKFEKTQAIIWLAAHQEAETKALISRFIQGQSFRLRRFDRKPVRSSVMIKRSHYASNLASTTQIDLLTEAEMIDFSKGGAQIWMSDHRIDRKEMVSLLYQNQHGQWLTIESQVRWVSDSPDGRKALGLQFIALSA